MTLNFTFLPIPLPIFLIIKLTILGSVSEIIRYAVICDSKKNSRDNLVWLTNFAVRYTYATVDIVTIAGD